MKRFASIAIAVLLLTHVDTAQDATKPMKQESIAVRFTAVDLFLDSSGQPLAAYQIHFSAGPGVKIVGIEGGEHPAFKEPPYYDPKAMQQERVIIAAFNTASEGQLPRDKTRVATIHLQCAGETKPTFVTKVETAANNSGQSIPIQSSISERSAK